MLNNINISGLSEYANEVKEFPIEGNTKWGVELNWVSGSRMHISTLPMQLGNNKLVRDFEFEVDEPSQLGGINCAPNPQEYLLTGVVSCIAVTFMAGVTSNKLAIDSLKMQLKGELNLAGFLGLDNQNKHAGFQTLELLITVKGEGDKELYQATIDQVKKYSPNFNNMENEVKIEPKLIFVEENEVLLV